MSDNGLSQMFLNSRPNSTALPGRPRKRWTMDVFPGLHTSGWRWRPNSAN